jgi:hypothetical protein
MMQTNEIIWSQSEKQFARTAFDSAYEREIEAILQEVRHQAGAIAEISDLWKLHDFLSARRHDLDGKYEYHYSSLIFVFAQLVNEGWISLVELNGLSEEKQGKIAALAKTLGSTLH